VVLGCTACSRKPKAASSMHVTWKNFDSKGSDMLIPALSSMSKTCKQHCAVDAGRAMTQRISLGRRGKMYSVLSQQEQQLMMLYELTAAMHPQEMLAEIKQACRYSKHAVHLVDARLHACTKCGILLLFCFSIGNII